MTRPPNPPDDHRLWQTMDALAHALAVALYDEPAVAVVRHAEGLWDVPYAEFDALTALGWVELIEEQGDPAYAITQTGQYWMNRWAGRMARRPISFSPTTGAR